MSLRDIILGRPLASSEKQKEELTVWTGVPVLGLDALASTGYGPEAALTVLAPLGVLGLKYYSFIVLAIVAKLVTLYLSYRQTAAAYPSGGGAYVVAKDNFNARVGVWAAVALLVDYLLNVAVAISAGIGAVVSAIPALHPHLLMLCLIVLLSLTFVNLRGVRESGLAFVGPLFVFIACIATVIVMGLARIWLAGGHPMPVNAPPPLPPTTGTVSVWLLLAAFANGCTAMTGIEAVSNGVPLFRKPVVPNAQKTLTVVMMTLSLFLLGLAYVCPAYQISAMNEQEKGYQTILSQLVAAVAGRGIFYYVAAASIFIVLTFSAQTSFTDFPRVCRLLAQDGFLPSTFATRGRRLVFSTGIIALALLSAVLLIVFGGVTDKLIPLFAVGAFAAFLFSQLGMVRHWHRKRGQNVGMKMFFNGLGAVTTAIVLVIIIIAKFVEGAWVAVLLIPVLVLLLHGVRRRYEQVGREVDAPMELQTAKLLPPVVIIPIISWNRIAEKAVRFGLLLSDDITAVHVSADEDNQKRLRQLWQENVEAPARSAQLAVPRLHIIKSAYRRINHPIVDFVTATAKERPGRLIAVIIPELVAAHWYDYLLYNLHGKWLKTLLYLKHNNRTIVINSPWYLHDV